MKYSLNILLVLLITLCYAKDNNLKNILLIINYNHAHYESIPLLKKIYGDYFNTIVFYGSEDHADVHTLKHNRGYFSYLAIADAMSRYGNFEGYLFLMDDCILNAHLLKDLDISKIWMPQISFMYSERGNAMDINQPINQWPWWNTEWGYEPMKALFKNIPPLYKNILKQNWGVSRVVAAYSDIVYIPSKYKEQFVELANAFGAYKIFLELALPTIISCLNSKDEWIWLKGHGTDRSNRSSERKSFKKDLYFNHPIKLSYKENRIFIEDLFNQVKCVQGIYGT